MSSKVSFWVAVKDNWTQVTGVGIVLVALHLFVMNVMVNAAVATKLGEQDIGTDSKIVAMDTEIDKNGAVGIANTARIEGNERRVELAFAALMGRPPPEEQ